MKLKVVFLHEIATCVPEVSYTQDFALDVSLRIQGDTEPKRQFLTKLYRDTGINKRHSVIDDFGKAPEDYTVLPKDLSKQRDSFTAEQRNDIFIREANRLSLKAVKKLLKKLPDFDKEKITDLITVSSTGFSNPGFDFFIAKQLPLVPSVERFNIGFMGCSAAFPAMRLARKICLAEPSSRVLIVNVEISSVHVQRAFEPELLVANAIFSDGVSAALVSAQESDKKGSKYIMHQFLPGYAPDSEDEMSFKIGDHGFAPTLSIKVPLTLKRNIKSIMHDLLQKAEISREEIDFWAIHPGGKSILNVLASTLGLSADDLKASYNVLREYGNMESATIMFVLKKMLESRRYGKVFSCGFGPGLTIETGYLEKIA